MTTRRQCLLVSKKELVMDTEEGSSTGNSQWLCQHSKDPRELKPDESQHGEGR